MNQILDFKNKKIKIKRIFRVQFFISFILILVLFIYILKQNKLRNEEIAISNIVSINAKLNKVFSLEESVYFGRIIIEKIDLDYYIYNSYTEEKLKALPCKYSGGKLNQLGNICIIGHNYYDDRFFSNLYKLNLNDSIIMQDLFGNKYKYTIYSIYEIDEKDINNAIKDENKRTITLCTCTLNKSKRLIIKAKKYE